MMISSSVMRRSIPALWRKHTMCLRHNAGAGLGNSPRTILEELARIQSHDVVLPTTTLGQTRLRCVTQPDAAHAALLDRLGLVLPKRMRLAEAPRTRLWRLISPLETKNVVATFPLRH
jgi:hypothetical protein